MTADNLAAAVSQVDALVRPPEDAYYGELESAYRKVRKFLGLLLRVIEFGSTPAGEPVLASLHYLRSLEEKGSRMNIADPPLGIVGRGWRVT